MQNAYALYMTVMTIMIVIVYCVHSTQSVILLNVRVSVMIYTKQQVLKS